MELELLFSKWYRYIAVVPAHDIPTVKVHNTVPVILKVHMGYSTVLGVASKSIREYRIAILLRNRNHSTHRAAPRVIVLGWDFWMLGTHMTAIFLRLFLSM